MSATHSNSTDGRTAGKASSAGLEWCGSGMTVALKGGIDLLLRRPMVYIFNGPAKSRNDEPAAIDVRFPVSDREHVSTGRELGYWPRYDGLTTGQRRSYLQWLAQGRASIPTELGYAFLFIYGLERRALVDRADQQDIFREVVRLRQLYAATGLPRNHSFDSYTSSFLWFLVAQHPQAFSRAEIKHLVQAPGMWSDQTLSTAIYWFVTARRTLSDWTALRIAQSLPGSLSSAPVRRVNQYFQALFKIRYLKKFPGGFPPAQAKLNRKYVYRPSSAALQPMEVVAPDYAGNVEHYGPLSDVWNECSKELYKLGAIASKDQNLVNSPEGWEATPAELRKGTLHPLTDAFCQLLVPHTNASGLSVLQARELALLLRIEEVSKFTVTQCRRVARIASEIGYCVEPDPVTTNKAWKVDRPVAFFLRVTDEEVDTSRYPAAMCMLRIGVAVKSAETAISEDAITAIMGQVAGVFDLNQVERRRLEAVAALLAITGAELAVVTRIVKDLPAIQREKMAKLTLVFASTDGIISTSELRIIRRVYTSLGFAAGEIERSINELRQDDEPTTVMRHGVHDPGEAIPPPEAAAGSLKLDHAAIAEIMKDTREVTEMLAIAMSTADNAEQSTETSPPDSPADHGAEQIVERPCASAPQRGPAASLQQQYVPLYEQLITKRGWTMAEAEALARQHGLMLGGAVEAINEWFFDAYGEQLLVEDSDNLLVETTAILQ
jgi:hypothetical protein